MNPATGMWGFAGNVHTIIHERIENALMFQPTSQLAFIPAVFLLENGAQLIINDTTLVRGQLGSLLSSSFYSIDNM